MPDLPPGTAPPTDQRTSDEGERGQPALGLLGLLLVVPIAIALAIGAGGDGSTLVIGPLVTHSLPLIAMIAFWWHNWPGTRLPSALSGWANTALIIVGAVVLTGLGQIVAGGLDLPGMFVADPGPGHLPTFPATLPVAGAAFVVMLQITLVGERRPLQRMHPLPAGLLAVAASWIIAVVGTLALVRIDPVAGSDMVARRGPVSGQDAGAALVVIGAWQVLFYVVWRGWPFSTIRRTVTRLGAAHATVLGAGILTFLLARVTLGLDASWIGALAGCVVAAGLLLGMLFENTISGRGARPLLMVATLALAALLAAGLAGLAAIMEFARADTDEWIEHAALNALSTSVILHVAIGRRWPFAPTNERTMTTTVPTIPVIAELIAAVNRGDRAAFLATLTPDATLTDDGSPRTLTDWIDREIFSANGRVTVRREEEGGLRLLARYRNDVWGDMSTFWRFQLTGDKISRIETGQA
ncbi:hypothetical protein PSU4_41690 [Pseudonocardia sulfidoxydans NBRC 16205]|uniref:Uncharacterized protein n=1 Tax=Pseudonocardia sulfidoxydans NBRC 16205 TaxID=1223511 RepID=A0A511DK90_9PSEU|nr:hypothetical protein PSU4_41690 [Pseudonocardia sulfidoxydans NBRC 16205]